MSSAIARNEGSSGAERPELAERAGAGGTDGTDAAPTTCRITRTGRLFVGFSEGMSLDDFELAAGQAERMLAFVERELCDHTAAVDPSGRLAAALRQGPLELFEVRFTRPDALGADVGLRQVSTTTRDAGLTLRVLVAERDGRLGARSVERCRISGVPPMAAGDGVAAQRAVDCPATNQ